jgi:hypothetical protein
VRLRLGRAVSLSVDFADDEDGGTASSVRLKVYQGRTAVPTDPGAVVDIAATGNGALWGATWTPGALGEYTGYWSHSTGYRRFVFEVTESPIVSVKDVRAFEAVLNNTGKFPAALVVAARDATEEEFERITGRSFVLRGKSFTDTLSRDSDFIPFPDWDVAKVTAITVNGLVVPTAGLTDTVNPGIQFVRPLAAGTVISVSYEYGISPPPADVKRAALLRVRDLLVSLNSGIPDRAVSFQVNDMGTYQLATAGRAGFETGIPEVDAILSRYDAERWLI